MFLIYHFSPPPRRGLEDRCNNFLLYLLVVGVVEPAVHKPQFLNITLLIQYKLTQRLRLVEELGLCHSSHNFIFRNAGYSFYTWPPYTLTVVTPSIHLCLS